MRQAVTIEPGSVRIAEAPTPVPGQGELLVRVEAVGICGSDIHLYRGRHPYGSYPLVQGHELVGTIVAAPDAADPRIGSRVAVDPVVACGECIACANDRPNACTRLRVLGVHLPGGFAEHVIVREGSVHDIGGLDPVVAALAEPFAVATHAVARAGVAAGDRVVVIGAGSIGRAIAMVAADRGAEVLVAGRETGRLRLADALGAHRVVNTSREDLTAAALDFSGPGGPLTVIEATGSPTAVRRSFELVAATGTLVIVGVSDDDVRLPVNVFTRKELTVLGSRNSAGEFPEAIQTLRRHEDALAGTISHRFPLERAGDALETATHHPALVTKAVIEPGADG